MAASGHTVAQMAQPVHPSLFVQAAVKYPLMFSSEDREMIFWGQKNMQSSQPLQNSREMIIFPFMQAIRNGS
jgi:hypothetical protein